MTQNPIPRATYRLQLSRDFTFDDAVKIAPYLGRLGISHAYLSPILEARPGSTHGYDTTEHTRINPELGGIEGFRRLAEALRAEGVGIILDIVPNHMGIGGDRNSLWLDVLEWGQASRYADWFDINWHPSEPSLVGKVLVPFLGSSYGEALDSGKIELRFDPSEGSFAVWAEGAHKLPVHPASYEHILGRRSEALVALGQQFAATSQPAAGKDLKDRLAGLCRDHREVAEGIAACLEHVNSEDGRDVLAELIAKQNWRLARYSVAADDINYRRFFIVSDLAAIRVEKDEVFEHVHRLTFDLIEEGLVEGLRVDHIDGLYDPKAYCLKLRERSPRPIYLVVEKILAPHESLRSDWDIEGTTGYEFATAVTQLLVDPRSQEELTSSYVRFTDFRQSFAEVERIAKLGIMDFEMGAELESLTTRLRAIASGDPVTADLTRNSLRAALREVISEMAVYRTYVDQGVAAEDDHREVTRAVLRAREHAITLDSAVFEFIGKVMLAAVGSGASTTDAVRDAALRIQQFTGPVMAKGLEDTALYRFNRLIALADVGEKPDRFGQSIRSFHDFNAERARHNPHGMLTTSSHDTKRGEDVRARIATLSGSATEWESAVAQWTELLAAQGAPEIDRNDLWHFFQLLLGAWPTDLAPGQVLEEGQLAPFRDRIGKAMLKSIREARVHTSWVVPRASYEDRVQALVDTALAGESDNRFLDGFRAFEESVALAGALNGLIETTLKLTLPGVPDIYQGAERWEQSMVDPDNRRPVDFLTRAEWATGRGDGSETDLRALLPSFRDGRIKQELIHRLLQVRAEFPGLFENGSYEPLTVDGVDSDRVLAFRRSHEGSSLAVVVGLFPWRGEANGDVVLGSGTWRDVLRSSRAPGDGQAKKVLDGLPVAVLIQT